MSLLLCVMTVFRLKTLCFPKTIISLRRLISVSMIYIMMTVTTAHDYHELLNSELARRKTINPRYSLRQFARKLKLSPAFLSKVLRKEKNLSIVTAKKIAKELKFSDLEMQEFCRRVAGHILKDEALTPKLNPGEMTGKDLELTKFQFISDWYHYALRELIATHQFTPDAEWLATRLGISADQATLAFERLKVLGLIKHVNGCWQKTDEVIQVKSTQPSQALRNHHSQMIAKAQDALETQNILQRDITGITIPTNPENIDKVRDEIRKFRLRMATLLSQGENTEVYQLNVQLFQLTTPTPSKKINSIKKNKPKDSQ